jgi:hypothetical protein
MLGEMSAEGRCKGCIITINITTTITIDVIA